jgi:hypothetical protein
MTLRIIAVLALAAGVTSCAPPPPYPNAWGAQAVVMGPLNAEPWVGTWSPSAPYQSSNEHQPFQTPNSLPVGAWTTPPYRY